MVGIFAVAGLACYGVGLAWGASANGLDDLGFGIVLILAGSVLLGVGI